MKVAMQMDRCMRKFAAATIQTIGRCATSITEVSDTCLNGLVCLLSNRDGELAVSFHLQIIYHLDILGMIYKL